MITVRKSMADNLHDIIALIEAGWDSKRVLVVGDVMLDKYIRGDVDRISPEAPVPVVHALHRSQQPGGAANVAMNIAGLGAKAVLVGFAGADEDHRDLTQVLQRSGVITELLTVVGMQTTSKLRIMGGSQQMMRLDIESTEPRSTESYSAIIEKATGLVPKVDAVVLSDYSKGALSEDVCRSVISAARKAGVPVLVDPKNRDFSRYSGATAICPNLKELALATGASPADLDDLLQKGQALVGRFGLDYLALTLSERGIIVLHEYTRTHAPAVARQVFDVSGAGDTVIATLALAAATGIPVEAAAKLANIAAGIVVGKVGTVPITHYEMVAALTVSSSTLVVEKVLDQKRLIARAAEWRAAGERIVFTNGCFDILHIGHVTLLEECRRLGTKVVVGVNSDASVRRLKGPERPVVGEHERARILSALASTDAITIFDQPTPLELILALRPEVLVKGGDYTETTIVGAAEMKIWGGRVQIVPTVPGFSTTNMLRQLNGQRNTLV
jgi:D-beta-D-heptose 7-phosphate kinase/D-beta-D-heptose 1-phosphate adenosyltransferase